MIGSCSSEEEGITTDYSFIDQVAQGQIEGKSWIYSNGMAIPDTDDEGVSYFIIRLYSTTDVVENVCDLTFPDYDRLHFNLPQVTKLYNLSLSEEGVNVLMFEHETKISNVANQGAIEILDITETQVIGRLDVRYNDTNFINGNFTLEICQD